MGLDGEETSSMKEGSDDEKSKHGEEGAVIAAPVTLATNPSAALLV